MTIKKLQAADAGRYCCGGERTMNVLYQEVELIVLDGTGFFFVLLDL